MSAKAGMHGDSVGFSRYQVILGFFIGAPTPYASRNVTEIGLTLEKRKWRWQFDSKGRDSQDLHLLNGVVEPSLDIVHKCS